MTTAFLEHINVTVSNPDETAELFTRLFDWKVRWTGSAINDGYTVHVGSDTHYLALYTPPKPAITAGSSYDTVGGLNHIGVVVEDLDSVEEKVVGNGYETFNHGSYDPGRRFYFRLHDGIEIEVISYN